ncbi:MAG: response regulator transcription factor [Nitrospirae bacterium]|nr:response regulator transcription factor [Nitrospirota bacterium]
MTRLETRKILAVDDEQDILELLSYNLSTEGFAVTTAADGEDALKIIRAKGFDLVILDLMLPDMSGMEICRVLRNAPETKNLPIIMLTAKTEEVDRIIGLEMGADDYITKPFSPRELIARVKAVLRRVTKEPVLDRVLVTGDLAINTETYSVTKNDLPLNLSSTEFRLLLYLVEKRGKVFSREHLLSAVWKDEAYVEPRTVDVHISRIRTQIEDNPSTPVYVKTRRGLGYFFDGEVSGGSSVSL